MHLNLFFVGIPLIYDLIQEIEDHAFCTGSKVLQSFGILNPHNLPDAMGDLANYGQVILK
jgi:hypothetical protein